jgi:hypothetical protein
MDACAGGMRGTIETERERRRRTQRGDPEGLFSAKLKETEYSEVSGRKKRLNTEATAIGAQRSHR